MWAMASTSTSSSESSTATSSQSTATRESSSTMNSDKVSSFLDRLKVPQPSQLSRKRTINYNPPPKGKQRSRGTQLSDPKSVSPKQRVSD